MNAATLVPILTFVLQLLLFILAIFYFAWKVPTKEDIHRLENRLNTDILRIEKKLDDLNQNFIDHLKNHP